LYVYDTPVKLPLRPGENLVVIKVPRQGLLWGFKAHLSTLAPELGTAALNAQSTREKFILSKNLFHNFDDPVMVAPRGVPSFVKFEGIVHAPDDAQTGVVENNRVKWEGTNAREGLHKLTIEINDMKYHEKFLVGRSDLIIHGALAEIDRLPRNPGGAGGFPALHIRLERALAEFGKNVARKNDGAPPQVNNWRWMRRVVHELWATQEALIRIQKGREPFSHVVGLHLNGFESKIDESYQCYRIYVPPLL
jgi:hypothetical protein